MSSIFPCVTLVMKRFFLNLPRAVKKHKECALEDQGMRVGLGVVRPRIYEICNHKPFLGGRRVWRGFP